LLFSKAEVPLIVDALPMLFHLKESLEAVVRDQVQNTEDDIEDDDSDTSSSSGETPAVIRIAAHAGVLLINKYLDLTWNCEIYIISIGALQYFFLSNLIANIYISKLCVLTRSFSG
jgi:hypothetical protein